MAETNAAMGRRLRELRLRRGLQQSEVARRLKISPAYLSLIEKGKRVVQLPLLFQALELYGIAVEDFMGASVSVTSMTASRGCSTNLWCAR
ncbi:MAG: helix-turn-helix domain-containing protein [Polyangiales bacterium]